MYAGAAYRHWQRDIQSVGSISGLDETYRWWSAQSGLNLEWRQRISPQLSTGLKVFYESWDLGRSGLETLTINGVPADNVFQPRIENRNHGFCVDIRHHW